MGSHWTIATRINKERRNKKERYKGVNESFSRKSSNVNYGTKNASNDELNDIATKMKKEHKQLLIKRGFLVVLVLIMIIVAFYLLIRV